MRAAVLVKPGMESIASAELVAFGCKQVDEKKAVVVFDADEKLLVKVAYFGQSFERLLAVLAEDTITSLDDLKKLTEKTDVAPWIVDSTLFFTASRRMGEHSFSRGDIYDQIGRIVRDKAQAIVEKNTPESIFFVSVVDSECILGIDLTGVDVSKREYRLFPKSTIFQSFYCLWFTVLSRLHSR